MWDVYVDATPLDVARASGSPLSETTAMGDADSAEAFLELVGKNCPTTEGSVLVFRKHIKPCCDELAAGGHFRVEETLTQERGPSESIVAGSLEFMSDVAAEAFARSAYIAGVGLLRSRHSVLLTLWLMSTDYKVVDGFVKELVKRVGHKTIRFIHHNTVPPETIKDAGGKLTLLPFIRYLAVPGINVSDLPSADEFAAPGASAMRRSSVPGMSSLSVPQDGSFNIEGNGPLSVGGTGSSSLSLFEHGSSLAVQQRRGSSEGAVLFQAPTPVADWTQSWSPSMFLAAQTGIVADNRHSSSTDSTSASLTTKERSPAGSPPVHTLTPPQPAHFTVLPVFSNSGGHTLVLRQPVSVHHAEAAPQPVAMQQPSQHYQLPPQYPHHVVQQQSPPPPGHVFTPFAAGAPSAVTYTQPPPNQAPYTQTAYHQQVPQAMYSQQVPHAAYSQQVMFQSAQHQPSNSAFVVPPPAPPRPLQAHQPYTNTAQQFTVQSRTAEPQHQLPPSPSYILPAMTQPMFSLHQQHSSAPLQQAPHLARQRTHGAPPQSERTHGAPPQSERKAFVFKGVAYPPGMNRKEYRLIVHHSEEPGLAVSCPEAFPVPSDCADGDLEPAVYERLRTEHVLRSVRM